MITCPWCGTHYTTFRSNCKNCGGPLPPPAEATATPPPIPDLPEPPPPPRAFKGNFVWKKLGSDGGSIVALVFLLLGFIFTLVGCPLTFAFLPGVLFAFLGLVFLGAGIPLINWRYRKAQQTLNVLRMGQATLGNIVDVTQNYNVTVNGRNPWTIYYNFQVGGRDYEGETTTLRPVGFTHHAGQPVYVLYLESDPAQNTIYPPVI